MQVLAVPSSLTAKAILPFFRKANNIVESECFKFDFQHLSWTPPFGMLLFGALLRQLRKRRPGVRFQAINHQGHSYQEHMGFFQNFGLAHGKSPGEATGSDAYLPIRILEFEAIHRDAAEHGDEVQDAVERHSAEISRVLAQSDAGDLVDTLSYSFREILRNSLEHSGAQKVGYCAQYWRSRNSAELAVIDTGCGILSSLSGNPHLELGDDRDAILSALLPGISGKFYSGIRSRPYDFWQNSGFGLYMISRLCGNGGSFLIISGCKGVRLEPSKSTWFDSDFEGTAIRAQLRTDGIGPLSTSLAAIRREGNQLAKEMGIGTFVSASRASSMLARDFHS